MIWIMLGNALLVLTLIVSLAQGFLALKQLLAKPKVA